MRMVLKIWPFRGGKMFFLEFMQELWKWY